MKKLAILPVILISLIACNQKNTKNPDFAEIGNAQFIDSADVTNNFYDNTETYTLPVKEITVTGEIANPGKVDFSLLPVHSVIVKETLLDSAGGDSFTGAFRYDGYSLFDILEKRVIRKANAEEFSPIIDLYVEIENDKGDMVVFSWAEIYYPNNLHKIIIATAVSRIVPSGTKDLWVLPEESKIVAACDLITERNISGPVMITVKSIPKSFNVVKGMSPMYSSEIKLIENQKPVGEISSVSKTIKTETYKTIFYGRGRGIHSTSPFTGMLLNEILQPFFTVSRSSLKSGIMCIVGQDGYRSAISYSELFNRNDQQEFLLVETAAGEDGGLFRIFAACDFFSDRAVKSVSEIHLDF